VDDVMGALRGQIDELRSIVEALDETQLALPSPCEGWSVSDVLLHLAQTNELAAASARGRLAEAAGAWAGGQQAVRTDVDEVAGDAVERERGATGAEVRERWVKSADDMAGALEACDPHERVRWVVGDMAPRSLATTRIAETWIHTGDVCAALGREQPASDRIWHIARLVHRTLPYSFTRAGLAPVGEVRFELTAPDDGQAVWTFGADDAATVISGPALDLCRVAGQRASAGDTSLHGRGPDAQHVLQCMRTFA
jgi:uncharacterized protein (TIGR03084 family)